MNLGKALKSIVRVVKENPTKAVAVGVLIGGPIGRLAAKAAPIIVAATADPARVRPLS